VASHLVVEETGKVGLATDHPVEFAVSLDRIDRFAELRVAECEALFHGIFSSGEDLAAPFGERRHHAGDFAEITIVCKTPLTRGSSIPRPTNEQAE